MSLAQESGDFEHIIANGSLSGEALERSKRTLAFLKARRPRCKGFAIGDGNFSGCAYGDGALNGSLGDDVCPVCNNTGYAAPA